MDGNYSSPSIDTDMSLIEASTLLLDGHSPRPYQAYCVTEASSRPPSPDTLRPRPLRVGKCLPQICDSELRCIPGPPLVSSTPAAIEQDRRATEIVPTLGNGSDKKEEKSNESRHFRTTMVVDSNHITRAVTPRGRHPLKDDEPIMYNRTPSQLRMQRFTPECVATTSTCQYLPVSQHVVDTSMLYHPLPPLPLDFAPIQPLHDNQRGSQEVDPNGVDQEAWWRSESRSGMEELSEGSHTSNRRLSRGASETKAGLDYEAASIRPSELVPVARRYLTTKRSYASRATPSPTTDSPACPVFGGHAQFAFTPEPYEPRGLLSEMEDDQRASRRTQPKDAKFRYQFGRRLSMRLDKPPPLLLHQSASISSLDLDSPVTASTREACEHFRRRSSSLSPRPYGRAQAGPRLPPWGSSDNLEMRRQTRNDAREREEARRYRTNIDSGSSISKGSESTESLRQNTMRREVEVYREQVLRLYPDMAFDGTAGKGGRSCYCVVM